MTLFYANSTTNGSALTNTKPSSTITSTASATATSTVSKEDAQNIANSEAQSLANQVAQNDANIISQTLNISTAGIKGAYSYLNLYEAIRCDVNPYTESGIYGIIFPVYISSVSKPNSGTCVISFEKQIYPVNSLDPNQTPPDKNNPYPNSTVKAFYNLNYTNLNGTETNVPIGAKSFLRGIRTSYKFVPNVNGTGIDYNIVVLANVEIYCNKIIDPSDPSTQHLVFLSETFLNKSGQSISTYNNNTKEYIKFDGVSLTQTFSNNSSGTNWNYLYTDFTNSTVGGSSTVLTYPYTINQNL
jgi:hypothetical protein